MSEGLELDASTLHSRYSALGSHLPPDSSELGALTRLSLTHGEFESARRPSLRGLPPRQASARRGDPLSTSGRMGQEATFLGDVSETRRQAAQVDQYFELDLDSGLDLLGEPASWRFELRRLAGSLLASIRVLPR